MEGYTNKHRYELDEVLGMRKRRDHEKRTVAFYFL